MVGFAFRKHLEGKQVDDTVFSFGENLGFGRAEKAVRDTKFTRESAQAGLDVLIKVMEQLFKDAAASGNATKADLKDIESIINKGYSFQAKKPSQEELREWFKAYFRTEQSMQDQIPEEKLSKKLLDLIDKRDTIIDRIVPEKLSPEDKRKEFESFLVRHNELVAKGTASSLRMGLMSLLGPASFLVSALDKMVDVDKWIGKGIKKILGIKNKDDEEDKEDKTNESLGQLIKLMQEERDNKEQYSREKAIEEEDRRSRERTPGGKEKHKTGIIGLLALIGGALYEGFKLVTGAIGEVSKGIWGLASKFASITGLSAILSDAAAIAAGIAKFAASPIGIAIAASIAAWKAKEYKEGLENDMAARGDRAGVEASAAMSMGGEFADPGAVQAYTDEVYARSKAKQQEKYPDIQSGAFGKTGSKLKMPSAGISKNIQDAANTVGVDPGTLFAMAKAESSFDPTARASKGSAQGLFQINDSTWKYLVGKYGKQYGVTMGDRNDPAKNALMAAAYAKENGEILNKANLPATPSNLYLSHFLGSADAQRFLETLRDNPDADAVALFPKAAANNNAIFFDQAGNHRSIGEVYERMFTGPKAKVNDEQVSQFNNALNPNVNGQPVEYAREEKESPAVNVILPEQTKPPVIQNNVTGSTLGLHSIPSFLSDEGLLILNTPGIA